jgi:hypothetical protein
VGSWLTMVRPLVSRLHDQRFWTPNETTDEGRCDAERLLWHRESSADNDPAKKQALYQLTDERHRTSTDNLRKCGRICCG